MRLNFRHPLVVRVALPAAGLFFISVAFLSFVYRASPRNGFARLIARTFNFPALRVGKKTIGLDEYYRYEDALAKWYGFNEESKAASALVRDRLMERMTVIALERAIAKEHGVRLKSKEIDAFASRLSAGIPDPEGFLRDRYGWSPRDFRRLIAEPLALERKLRAEVSDFENILPERIKTVPVKRYLE